MQLDCQQLAYAAVDISLESHGCRSYICATIYLTTCSSASSCVSYAAVQENIALARESWLWVAALRSLCLHLKS